jgi:hypothetical protein
MKMEDGGMRPAATRGQGFLRYLFFQMDSFCPCAAGRLGGMKQKSKFMQALKHFVCEPLAGRSAGGTDDGALSSFAGRDESKQVLEDALHFRSAEYWLKLGHPTEALAELEALSAGARQQVSVLKLQVAAMRDVREGSSIKEGSI